MKVAVLGLGRMGHSIVKRLLGGGHEVVAFDPSVQARQASAELGASVVENMHDAVRHVHAVWLMVPAGKIVDDVLHAIVPHVAPGTIIVDGGNSNFHDSTRRYALLKKHKISFIDCGTSGGLQGEHIGFSLMIGGDKDAYTSLEPVFKSLAAPNGYAYLGQSGAGHYVKMVHNGIEYALLQAYSEGLHVLKDGAYPNLDLAAVTGVWQHGSIIRSWINELLHEVFTHDQDMLAHISGAIGENQTGRWTLEEAQARKIPVKLLEDALNIRTWSRETGGNFATKLVAMLRYKFGGHATKKE